MMFIPSAETRAAGWEILPQRQSAAGREIYQRVSFLILIYCESGVNFCFHKIQNVLQ